MDAKKEVNRTSVTTRRDYWKKLKHYATEKEIPLQNVIDEAIKEFIEKIENKKEDI